MTTPPPPPPGSDPSGQGHPQQGSPQQGYQQGQPQPPQQGSPQQSYPAGGSGGGGGWQRASSNERTWSILAHLSAPAAFLLSAGSLSFLGPLVIWAVYKERSPLVRRAAAGSFNFNVTVWLIYIAAWVLVIFTLGLGFLVAIPVWIALFVIAAVLHVQAALKASRGETYTYPLQIPILS